MIREYSTTVYSNLTFTSVLLLLAIGVAVISVYSPIFAIVGVALVVGGIAAILISVRWPEAFLILALWTNFMKSAYIPGLAVGEFGATPYMIFTTLATVGFCVQILAGKRRLILPVGICFLSLFIILSTISLLIVQNFRLAIGLYARNLLDWMLVFSLVQMLVNRRRVKLLLTALLILAFVITFWGIASGIQLELTDAHFRSLFFWRQYQKNDFAAFLGLVLVLALATFSVSKSWPQKVMAFVLIGAVPIGWMFTFSRGGFLAIATCLVVFLALERNKKLLRRSFLAIFLVGGIGLGVVLFVPSEARTLAVDGLQSIVTGENFADRRIDTIELRVELVQAAVEVIASRPVLGVGFNQWQFYSPIITRVCNPQAGGFRETRYSVHSRSLLIAARRGVI
jgi:O-antigen ligase